MMERFEEMGEAMDLQMLNAENALRNKLEDAKETLNSESGAVDIVVILLLVVVVIALVAIFRNQLTSLVNGVFTQLQEALGL